MARVKVASKRPRSDAQYVITKQGAPTAALSGITPGLFVDVHLPALDGQSTTYNAIVRACPANASTQCAAESDAGWGPWSQNVTGVVTFTFTP